MLLLQLQEITSIDSEIVQLHERLSSLYKERADLTSTKAATATTFQALDDTIDLTGIDLSLSA